MRTKDTYTIFDTIRDQCGDEVANRVQEVFGGGQINIPAAGKLKANSLFVKELGFEIADKVSRAVTIGHNEKVVIPIGRHNHMSKLKDKAASLLRRGLPVRKVASELKVHERTVFRVRADLTKVELPEVIAKFDGGASIAEVAPTTVVCRSRLKKLYAEAQARRHTKVPS
jgi:hypothetical protein